MRTCDSQSDDSFSSPIIRRRRWTVAIALFVATATSGGERLVTAQSSSTPTVVVRRNAAVNFAAVPGDFNGDGILDVAASDPWTDPLPKVLVAPGKGDGTFGAPIRSTATGFALAAADFDGDGRLDLVVGRTGVGEALVLPGRGDGTFGTPVVLAGATNTTFAIVADFDGDGHLDLALGFYGDSGSDGVALFAGHGDGSFTAATRLVSGTRAFPAGAAAVDLNGDHRPDLAVANHDGHSIGIFVNNGSFLFTPSDIAIDAQANDIAAADVNHDGKPDLLVATANDANDDFNYLTGNVYVLLGNGGGTFAPPTKYPTARGAWRIAVGDFTRDGILDVATANRSEVYFEDCGPLLKGTDSVSILPGRSDGTFGAASSFALGNQRTPTDTRFRNSVRSLYAADINRDGAADLVASWGAVLINNPNDPNWAPTVDAGPDRTITTRSITIVASADDVDQDYLSYEWTSSDGTPLPDAPEFCVQGLLNGPHTYTVRVSDGHGHSTTDSVTITVDTGTSDAITITAPIKGEIVPASKPYTIRWTAPSEMANEELLFSYSADGGKTFAYIWDCMYTQVSVGQCTWNNPGPASDNVVLGLVTRDADVPGSGATGPFTIKATPGAPPWPWIDGDVGAVAKSGSASFANGVFTVSGSGADIWGSADEFHYLYQYFNGGSGEVEVIARVDSEQTVNPWTKAGLMLRGSLDPSSSHASIFVTPGRGIAFQSRSKFGGASVTTAGPSLTAPIWLRLVMRRTIVAGYYKQNDGDPWTKVGESDLGSSPVAGVPYVGLAVTSHQDGTLAAAAFSHVAINPWPNWSVTSAGANVGSGSEDNGVGMLTSRGTDIWGTADGFTFLNTTWDGDGTLQSRVMSVDDANVWTKAGVMFRVSRQANSPHVMVAVTPGHGIVMQYRATTGGTSVQAAQVAGTAPVTLRLVRQGNVFTGAWSNDSMTWNTLASVTVSMPPEVFVGLSLTSHDTGVTASADFWTLGIFR